MLFVFWSNVDGFSVEFLFMFCSCVAVLLVFWFAGLLLCWFAGLLVCWLLCSLAWCLLVQWSGFGSKFRLVNSLPDSEIVRCRSEQIYSTRWVPFASVWKLGEWTSVPNVPDMPMQIYATECAAQVATLACSILRRTLKVRPPVIEQADICQGT